MKTELTLSKDVLCLAASVSLLTAKLTLAAQFPYQYQNQHWRSILQIDASDAQCHQHNSSLILMKLFYFGAKNTPLFLIIGPS